MDWKITVKIKVLNLYKFLIYPLHFTLASAVETVHHRGVMEDTSHGCAQAVLPKDFIKLEVFTPQTWVIQTRA